MLAGKTEKREKRRLRIRKRVIGNPERPRMSIFKSLRHLYVQVVDDSTGRTLAAVTTNTKDNRGKSLANIAGAKTVGQQIADRAKAAGVTQVVFDRSGYPYHGVVKAIADSAREAGLKF